jgi:S-adenosyl-L-methionine hydrolase (adenosine-forming)
MAPVVTLTTDFGTFDAYVAEMKGVLVSEGPPDLRIVDLSHELRPFDVAGAALFLRQAVPRFPRGTIHVAVVDPGVGSARKAIVARSRDQLLVGPDNRLFGYLFGHDEEVFEIDPAALAGRSISSTFHGRDLFAPVAALLARGARPEELGTPAQSYEHLVFPLVDCSGDVLTGRVIHVDHYGNLITNIARATLAGFLGETVLERGQVHVGERVIRGIARCYADAKPGELLALFGSSELLEVAQREGSAAERLSAQVGKLVRVSAP